MIDAEHYLKITRWAQARYTRTMADGQRYWVRSIRGNTVPSRATLIEDLAAERYMHLPRHWPGFHFSDLPRSLFLLD